MTQRDTAALQKRARSAAPTAFSSAGAGFASCTGASLSLQPSRAPSTPPAPPAPLCWAATPLQYSPVDADACTARFVPQVCSQSLFADLTLRAWRHWHSW